MKKNMDLKSLWARASKARKLASTSTPKSTPVDAESQPRNNSNALSNDVLQVVPVHAQIHPITEDDESGDQDVESLASNIIQYQSEAVSEKSCLIHALKCLRFLLKQGLAVHGHYESEGFNEGNFVELCKWMAETDARVKGVVLKDTQRKYKLIDQNKQEQLANSCAKETSRLIIEDLGDDYFATLVYESTDLCQQEELSLCLRYVDKKGIVVERFLGIVEVEDATSLTVQTTIENLLMEHSLSFSMIRGLGYDGTSNMKGYDNGLKKLIMDESPSAYYVHCFARQLQLTLVAVAKENTHGGWLFYHVEYLLNVLRICREKIRMLTVPQAKYIIEALVLDKVETEECSNQQISLGSPSDTRCGSCYRTVMHIISLYPSIGQILTIIGEEHDGIEAARCQTMMTSFESFRFVFMAHLLQTILEYTDDLCTALQKRDQDIVHAIDLVYVTKEWFQLLREDDGWEGFLQKVTSFCVKHEIEVVDMDVLYEPIGRSSRLYRTAKNLHYYHVDMFLDVIDRQLQELDHMFDEVNTELLLCVASFNPADSFAAYDEDRLVKLAHFYPKDFSKAELLHLPYQLTTFVADMRSNKRFREVKNLVEVSVKLVETKKDQVYQLVYKLLKLVLLLPVATATVERNMSSVKYVEYKASNKMSGQCMNDCLVTFLEGDFFLQVQDDAIISRFQATPSVP